MKIATLILTTFILGACASAPAISNNTWDVRLQTLQGKSFEDARTALGTPETFYDTMNGTTYIWRQRTADGPNAPRVREDWRPSRVSSAVVNAEGRFVTCTIKAETINQVISRIWSEGTAGGCAFINDPRNNVPTVTGIQ